LAAVVIVVRASKVDDRELRRPLHPPEVMEAAVDRILETEDVSPEISDNDIEPENASRRRKLDRSSNDTDAEAGGANSKKTLVADYVSDVSSEDFSGPEDGECESDGGGHTATATSTSTTAAAAPVRHHRSVRNSLPSKSSSSSNRRRVVLPPEPARSVNILPSLVENASPIEDDDLDNLSKFFGYFSLSLVRQAH